MPGACDVMVMFDDACPTSSAHDPTKQNSHMIAHAPIQTYAKKKKNHNC